MIAKDSTVAVNFLVLDTDGFPATGQASNISASISINGAQATAIADTITEKGSGWYYFNHTFSIAGNVFIEFAATDCIIMPWEDEVVEVTGTSANDVARAVWSDTASYPIFQGQYPKGYYQANPPVVNVWGQTAYSGQSITYGDLMKSTAKSSELTGLSTFNAATDTVTINATQAATMVTATGFATPSDIPTSDITAIKTKVDSLHNTDLTGIATTTDVSDAQSAIIAAIPDVSNLSTFDPATDKVTLNTTEDGTLTAIKTKVDTLQNTDISTLAKSSELAGLSTFDPANDQVSVSAFSASFIANQVWSGKEAYATPTDVSDAIRTINVSLGLLEEHGDTNWSTANISGLSTFNPATDTVLIDSTQAATMATATGFATPSNITNAQQAIINHGDSNWVGGDSGGATAQQIWEYPTRTITASPTDISSLATKTDLSNAQTAVISAMPSVTGLATSTEVNGAKADIIAAIPTIPTDYAKTTDIPDISGLSTFNPATDSVQLDSTQLSTLATGSEITDAKDDIIAALADIDIDTSDLAKATDVAVIADMIKQVDAGVLHWATTATRLTLYNEDNSVLRIYALERDSDGNITRINPLA